MRKIILFLSLCLFAISAWCWPADSLWVTYAPTNFDPTIGLYPSTDAISVDLDTLYIHHFRGLCTYGSENTLGQIPQLARQRGFTGKIIMGIWNPASNAEWSGALSASEYVDGYCIGNEGLTIPYAPPNTYDTTMLAQAMDSLRNLTGKAVTTSEPIEAYFSGEFAGFLLNHGDWLFPIIHPYWHDYQDPGEAVLWTLEMYDSLSSMSELPIIIKETGWPTDGAAIATPAFQAQFYEALLDSMQAGRECKLFFFEAYDQYWKTWAPVEPYWGLFDRYRIAKPVVAIIESYYLPVAVKTSPPDSDPPSSFALTSIHPNPGNATATLSFDLPLACQVTVELFDLTGKSLELFIQNEWMSPGVYEMTLKATHLTSGVYIILMRAGNFTATGKMVLMK